MAKIKSDIEIARASKIKPISDVLKKYNIPNNHSTFSPMGRHIAKLNFEYIDKLKEKKSNLILAYLYSILNVSLILFEIAFI